MRYSWEAMTASNDTLEAVTARTPGRLLRPLMALHLPSISLVRPEAYFLRPDLPTARPARTAEWMFERAGLG